MSRPNHEYPPRACFVALGAYPLFDPTVQGPMGGMESRAWTFARALHRSGALNVSFVVEDCGQGPVREFNGITVYARRNSILQRFVRSGRSHRVLGGANQSGGAVHGRPGPLTGARRAALRLARALWSIPRKAFGGLSEGPLLYARIPADVFLTFGVSEVSAEVIASCKELGRKSILCIAHDCDLEETFMRPTGGPRPDGVPATAGHYALLHADEIIVQSQSQKKLLRERFGRFAHLISNPIDLTGDDTEGRPLETDIATVVAKGPYVLWVGRSDPVYKRPALCFELARRLPQVRFVMVMARTDAACHAELTRLRPPNVDLIDGLPFRAMPHLFRGCLALVSTSLQEGFPNTFLQAGKYRVPVVSLIVDPDEMFWSRKVGIICHGNLDVMANAVADLVMHPERREHYAGRLADYVSRYHDLPGRCDELSDVILRTIGGDEASPFPARTCGGQNEAAERDPTRAPSEFHSIPHSQAS